MSALVVIAACMTTPRVVANSTLDDTLAITLGATVATSDRTARITFDKTLPDSRCAVGHTCVWQGDAAAGLVVEREKRRTHASVHTALEPRVIAVGDLSISLLDLKPWPGDTSWTRPAEVRIRVARRR